MNYKEIYDEEYIKDLLIKLCELGPKKAVLTGVSFTEKEQRCNRKCCDTRVCRLDK